MVTEPAQKQRRAYSRVARQPRGRPGRQRQHQHPAGSGVVYAPAAGAFHTGARIGDVVRRGEVIGTIGDVPLASPLDGVLRGLTRDGVSVTAGTKIVELDPRGPGVGQVVGLGERPLRIAASVLEVIERWRPS